MPEFTAQIVARAAITAVHETAAGEVADELAKELAALAADMPIYEMEVDSVIASGEPEEPEQLDETATGNRTEPKPARRSFEPSYWKIGLWVAGVWWLLNGFYVAAYIDKSSEVNPLFHTVTIKTEYELPADQAERVGALIGMRLIANICETNAAKLPGFGWGVTLEGKDGEALMSCWSWQ